MLSKLEQELCSRITLLQEDLARYEQKYGRVRDVSTRVAQWKEIETWAKQAATWAQRDALRRADTTHEMGR